MNTMFVKWCTTQNAIIRRKSLKFVDLKTFLLLLDIYFYVSAAGEAYNASFTRKDLEESTQKWLRRAKERYDVSEKKLQRTE